MNLFALLRIMSDDDEVLKRGPFKGKKITYASTERIEEFRDIASEFVCEIFDLLPGEYLISDESDLDDFTEIGSSDTSQIWKRITETYGLVLSDVESERLVSIFIQIARRRNLQ